MPPQRRKPPASSLEETALKPHPSSPVTMRDEEKPSQAPERASTEVTLPGRRPPLEVENTMESEPALLTLPRVGVEVNPQIVADDLRLRRRTQSVELMQRQLTSAGFYAGKVDGDPGPATCAAYGEFSEGGLVDAEALRRLGFDIIT